MASHISARYLPSWTWLFARQPSVAANLNSRCARAISTASPPPLLAILRGDLKNAMRNKDTPRLSALRAIINAFNSADKSLKPIQTDVQLVSLIRRTARSSLDAAAEARKVGREDLVEKEEAQARVLEEYAKNSGVTTITGDTLKAAVEQIRSQIPDGVKRTESGYVPVHVSMKLLFGEGGLLEGKDIDKTELLPLLRKLQ